MASSSVSQEDLENDFELTSRRSRIRSARARTNTQNPTRFGKKEEFCAIGQVADLLDEQNQFIDVTQDGEDTFYDVKPSDSPVTGQVEHDASPKPLGRCKEKRGPRCVPIRQPLADHINRANHVNKGKQQRDRRKLREKRRSTGVVHLQSTESTGGSTGEDEDEVQLSSSVETRTNTLQNEQLPELPDKTYSSKTFQHRRSKSPSDRDADYEDNQNQSDSTAATFPVQRPATPTGETVEERLERAQAENRRLLSLLEEKDRKLISLEAKIRRIQTETSIEKTRLLDEIATLIHTVASLKPK